MPSGRLHRGREDSPGNNSEMVPAIGRMLSDGGFSSATGEASKEAMARRDITEQPTSSSAASAEVEHVHHGQQQMGRGVGASASNRRQRSSGRSPSRGGRPTIKLPPVGGAMASPGSDDGAPMPAADSSHGSPSNMRPGPSTRHGVTMLPAQPRSFQISPERNSAQDESQS